MFNKPLSQIQYSDIEAFCKTFSEGVSVEYKSQIIKELPKVISAFANTLGGIIVIGVETEKVSNKVTNILGVDREEGIEEKIINSSLQGIYPGILPEVKILDVPSKKDKVIVVIKVHESLESPHTIENTTKVYVRTGSVSQPYELSRMDRIEYLLNRRNKQEGFREQLKQDARQRAERLLINNHAAIKEEQSLEICVCPNFPYQPLLTLESLHGLINNSESQLLIPFQASRTINGMCEFSSGVGGYHYIEINQYGLVFRCFNLHNITSRWGIAGLTEEEKKKYIYFGHIVSSIGSLLKKASSFYDNIKYSGNLEISVKLKNIVNQSLMYVDNGYDIDYKALENEVNSKEIILAGAISGDIVKITTSLVRNILWIFNIFPEINPERRVLEVFNKLNLIEGTK